MLVNDDGDDKTNRESDISCLTFHDTVLKRSGEVGRSWVAEVGRQRVEMNEVERIIFKLRLLSVASVYKCSPLYLFPI